MDHKLGAFDSWTVESENIIKKKCDKSFFDYRGSGVPAGVRWFFNVESLNQGEKKDMTLVYNGAEYTCYVSRETNDTARTRMFWDTSLDKELAVFKTEDGIYPTAVFTRVGEDKYNLEMIQMSGEKNSEWVISGNPTAYDVVSAFKKFNKINWKQVVNYNVGDTIFLYVSKGYQQIKYKLRVNKTELEKPEIDDSEFNVSGEYDGTYGRYIEVELLQEFDCPAFQSDYLKRMSFRSPQSPVRTNPMLSQFLNVMSKLLQTEEMDPDKHDGSYELVREIVNAYAQMQDLSACGVEDLNLLYTSTVGTWSQGVDSKKSNIDKSNLPESEKARLKAALDKVWENAGNRLYENRENDTQSIGMFGTGFFSFKGSTSDEQARDFISLCIDLLKCESDDEAFDLADVAFSDGIPGIQAASASMMLHCLMPNRFPVLNSNSGSEDIYKALGIDIQDRKNLDAYIGNCRKIKEFRNNNLPFKNYRILDLAARDLKPLGEIADADSPVLTEFVTRFLTDYIPAKSQTFGGHAFGNYIRKDVPDNIYKTGIVDKNKYLISGSVGQGNWAMVPWVCIFDKSITTTATKGVYIVYLLSKDGKSLYLTFNQGCTEIRNKNSKKETIKIMRAKADELAQKLDGRGFNSDEDIDLGDGLTELGEMYQKGAIFYKKYELDTIPSEEDLRDDLKKMMDIYVDYTNVQYDGIDIESIVSFIDKYAKKTYQKPEKADNPEEMELFSSLGIAARENFTKYVNAVCAGVKNADQYDIGPSTNWINQGQTCPGYLWIEVKRKDRKEFVHSISFCVERNIDKGEIVFSTRVEVKDANASPEDYVRHNTLVDIPITADIFYEATMTDGNIYAHEHDEIEQMKAGIEDGTIKKLKVVKAVPGPYSNSQINQHVQDGIKAFEALVAHYDHVVDQCESAYWPDKKDYDPGLSKEDWFDILSDSSLTTKEDLRLLKCILLEGGESTCANLAAKYGGTAGSYNMRGSSYGKKISEVRDIPPCKDGENLRYFPIPFVGRNVVEEEKRRYSWKLRDELKEAIEEMDLSEVEVNVPKEITEEFDKNMILYGPPGTGKTYNTAIYAVAICDGKSIDELTDYDAVMTRYNELKAQHRIAFTTFHQSYGYEEFIEGIRPVLSDNSEEDKDIDYTIEPGAFKAFCDKADEKKYVSESEGKISENPVVWKISLEGSGDTPTKRDCFENNRIRIGWSNRDKYITDETECNSKKERTILTDFEYSMSKGDLVVVLRDQYSIDAIGVITGDYEWLEDGGEYPRSRSVEWLAKNINVDIREANSGKALTSSTVYKLNVDPDVIIKYAKDNNDSLGITVEDNDQNFVFIIDEINRGNISKIFGELITLIENTKRKGQPEAASAILPYSKTPFSVPSNVYILGTMNTADRSIALMDTALRRRFQFVEMMPDAEVLRSIGADKVVADNVELDVAAMLETINERISFLYDREHTIGHAFFTGLKDDPSIEKLASIFAKSVIPLLQEYFYEDYQKIQLVLGDNGKTDENHKFIKDIKVVAKNIFKGSVDDVIDLPEKKYEVNEDALMDIQSYIEII